MPSDIHLDLVDRVRIAAPCPVQWEDLDGDGPVRHCGQCDMSVFNFTQMPRAQVQELLAAHAASGERLCGVLYRRTDGTFIQQDCPVGLKRLRQQARRSLARVAAALGLLLTTGLVFGRFAVAEEGGRLRTFQPFAAIGQWLTKTPPPTQRFVAGRICIPAPTPSNTTNDDGAEGG